MTPEKLKRNVIVLTQLLKNERARKLPLELEVKFTWKFCMGPYHS
jgi:hypothetical protein